MFGEFKVKRINYKCILPQRMTETAAGFDIYACLDENIVIEPMERKLIPTGFCMSLFKTFEAQIRPRSGLAWKYGITVLNSPGTIDADFRGEVKVMLVNLGKDTFTISHGMRIAQMVVSEFTDVKLVEVDTLDDTDRGTGSFGSTGI